MLGLSGFASIKGEASTRLSPTQDPSADIVTSIDYVEWDQMATAEELARLRFVARVDGARITLSPSCDSTPSRAGFHCSSPLPPLLPGRHILDLTAVAFDGDATSESESSHLEIIKIGHPSTGRAVSVPATETQNPGSI